MKKRLLLFLLLFALLVPQAFGKQIDVTTYVISVEEYDIETGKYTVHFFLGLDCDFDCSPKDIIFLNGRITDVSPTGIDPTTGMKAYLLTGTFENNVELYNYPFDTQQLSIEIEQAEFEKIELRPNLKYSGIDSRVTFPGWDISKWNAKVVDHYYPQFSTALDLYVFTMEIDRREAGAVFKHFFPVFVLILILLFSSLLGLKKMEFRLGIISSILIAAMVFHLSISSGLPSVGYTTFADRFMIATYSIALVNFFTNLWIMRLVEKNKKKKAETFDLRNRYATFIGAILLYVVLFLFFL